MGEAEIAYIRDQPLAEFLVAEIAVALLRNARPGAEMALVDRDRALPRLRRSALLDPVFILPFCFRQTVQDRCCRRRMFGTEGHGVGLQRQDTAGMVPHFIFVALALRQFRNEELPDAGLVAKPHRMASPVPDIEIAHDADIV